ncbi:MAG: FG-GAP-like repeat-containing protein [Calditrichia bacterium]
MTIDKQRHFVRIIVMCLALWSTGLFAQSVTFTNIVDSTNTNFSGDSYGTSWQDIDGDGLLDLFIANTSGTDNLLFRNLGDDIFEEKAAAAGIAGDRFSRFASWGDVDGDGDLDVYVGNLTSDSFYRNEDGIFVDATSENGFIFGSNSYSAAWADYDGDDDLDLFVANLDGSNLLYRNNGDFMEVSNQSGMSVFGPSRAISWADFDNDGDLDAYVCRGVSSSNQHDLLYLNTNGVFSEVSFVRGITTVQYSLGADWGDYDNDGDLDLFVATAANQPNHLYQNNAGSFTDVTDSVGMNDLSSGNSFTPSWLDYDNDGDLDLLVARDSNFSNVLYENNGGVFTQVQLAVGLELDTGRSISIAVADYNEDGFQDIYFPNRFGENAFFRNNGNNNSWLAVKLQGLTLQNTAGIGARVTVVAGNLRQIRELRAGSGQSAQHSPVLGFGLAGASLIDSLIVDWPGQSGGRIVKLDVPVNQKVTMFDTSEPLLIDISPDHLAAGTLVSTDISAANTSFTQGAGVLAIELQKDTVVVAASSILVLSDNLVRAEFDLADTLMAGRWDVLVNGDIDGELLGEDLVLLSPANPIASTAPEFFELILNQGDSSDLAISISNLGPSNGANLEWSAGITERITGERPSGALPAGTVCYGIDRLGGNTSMVRFGTESPGNVTEVGNTGLDIIAGDFGPANQFFAIDQSSSMLVTVDTTNGSVTSVGTMLIVSGHTWSGLTYEAVSNTLFASSTDNSTSFLYEVDATTGTTTIIGETIGAPLVAGIAVSPTGVIYAHEIQSDALYILDRSSGEADIVGFTGFDASSAQGMDFDQTNGNLYLAAFGSQNFHSELRQVDPATGGSMFIGQIGQTQRQITAFGIGGSGVSFLRITGPVSGSIAPGDVDGILAQVRAPMLPDTILQADIVITLNDPELPSVRIPVDLTVGSLVGLPGAGSLPQEFSLERNYPNPFNPSTTIAYSLPKAVNVSLEVFNMLGQRVRSLVNERQESGVHEANWNGLNDAGNAVASGTYIYRLKAGRFQMDYKMILVK